MDKKQIKWLDESLDSGEDYGDLTRIMKRKRILERELRLVEKELESDVPEYSVGGILLVDSNLIIFWLALIIFAFVLLFLSQPLAGLTVLAIVISLTFFDKE